MGGRAVFEALSARVVEDSRMVGKVSPSIRLNDDNGLAYESYAVVFPTSPAVLDDDRVSAVQSAGSDAVYDVDVLAVGTSALNCQDVADILVAQLAGARLLVEGRRVRSRLSRSGRVEPDVSVKPPLFYCELSFEVRDLR